MQLLFQGTLCSLIQILVHTNLFRVALTIFCLPLHATAITLKSLGAFDKYIRILCYYSEISNNLDKLVERNKAAFAALHSKITDYNKHFLVSFSSSLSLFFVKIRSVDPLSYSRSVQPKEKKIYRKLQDANYDCDGQIISKTRNELYI